MSRRAFSIPEVLIASLLAATVLTLTLHLWSSSTRTVTKGEESLTSLQDASLVLLHLRRDLQRLCLPGPARPWDLRLLEKRGTLQTHHLLRFDPDTLSLANQRPPPDPPPAHDLTLLAFHVFREDLQGTQRIRYRYQQEERTLWREAQDEEPRAFALPRLQEFRLQPVVALAGGGDLALLGADTPETGRLLQLWFEVRFEVQAEEDATGIRPTRIELETRIFPRDANRHLHRRWTGAP